MKMHQPFLIFSSLLASTAFALPSYANDRSTLEAEFANPPQEARPRVWWHWLNGNVTKDGIAKDLEWMKRVGIGGVQTFDINFSTPTVVKERLLYMTPAWKDAFRFAAGEADRHGLEMTVAASPGWSETGGPWVPPADGMKKLVWSITDLSSADTSTVKLAMPPLVTGPYQELPLAPEPGAEKHIPPQHYADVAVLAYPVKATAALPAAKISLANGTKLDSGRLTDGQFAQALALPGSSGKTETTVLIEFDSPQTIRAFNMFSNANMDVFTGSTVSAILESKAFGESWTKVAQFNPSIVPTTISFAPVAAPHFRLRLIPRESLSPIDSVSAPGYAGINYSQFLNARPIQLAELRLLPEARVNRSEEKAGFAIARNYYAVDGGLTATETGIASSEVIDLTSKLRTDGTLEWRPPAGHWRIVRFGTSLTGKTNHPAPAEATGLEVDKMDGAAVRRYMGHYIGTYRATVGNDLLGARGVNAILTDSTEVGAFNWTPAMREQFRKRRGYDPLRWLPALSGEIIGSRDQSDKFLYDFRRTIADLHASEHYGTVAEVAHENGLKVYGEALEGWRVSLGDDIDMRAAADIPMAAMWTYPRELGPRPLLLTDLRTAASAAHLAGKPIVAAESMTSSRYPWAHSPADLRRIVDTEFAGGINRIVIHTSPHQPVDNKKPGLSLRHIGQFFTRHETWAEMAKPWIDYIARSSHMLQQGRFVADVAYFLGEEAPAGALVDEGYLRDVPTRHGYDFVNATAILKQFDVKNGELTTAGGARYRVLYLSGTSKHMTLPVLRRIRELVRKGAHVVGDAPMSSPSLADNPKQFASLVRKMWSGKPITRIGEGQIIAGKDIEAALARLGVQPDFATNAHPAAGIDFVHRQLADGDIYFVRNGDDTLTAFDAHFRISGKIPELWDAVTGAIEPVSFRTANGKTKVALTLLPEESRFVVFRKTSSLASVDVSKKNMITIANLDKAWSVAFEADRGAPIKIGLSSLKPLNESADPSVRYFSGVATYSSRFTLQDTTKSLFLDLGKVGDLAEVLVNGQSVGTVWTAPYQLDVSRFVQAGENLLEVRVANLWHNRLIGDAQPSATKIAWTASPMYKADAPLRPAGLMGPVTLLTTGKDPQ